MTQPNEKRANKPSPRTSAGAAERHEIADACWNAFLTPDPNISSPASKLVEHFEGAAFAAYADLLRWAREQSISPQRVDQDILDVLETAGWVTTPENGEYVRRTVLAVYGVIVLVSLRVEQPDLLDYSAVANELNVLMANWLPEEKESLGLTDVNWPAVAALSMSGKAREISPPIDVPVVLRDRPHGKKERRGYLCNLRLDIIETSDGAGLLLGYHPKEVATRRFRVEESSKGGNLSFSQGMRQAWETACAAAGRSDVCARWSLHPLAEKEPMPEVIDGASFSAAAARAWALMLQGKKVDPRLLVSAQIREDGRFYPVGGIRQKTTRLTEILRDPDSNCQIDRIAVVGEENLKEAKAAIEAARLQDRLDAVRIDLPETQ